MPWGRIREEMEEFTKHLAESNLMKRITSPLKTIIYSFCSMQHPSNWPGFIHYLLVYQKTPTLPPPQILTNLPVNPSLLHKDISFSKSSMRWWHLVDTKRLTKRSSHILNNSTHKNNFWPMLYLHFFLAFNLLNLISALAWDHKPECKPNVYGGKLLQMPRYIPESQLCLAFSPFSHQDTLLTSPQDSLSKLQAIYYITSDFKIAGSPGRKLICNTVKEHWFVCREIVLFESIPTFCP